MKTKRHLIALMASLLFLAAANPARSRTTNVTPQPLASRQATALDAKMDAPLRLALERSRLSGAEASAHAAAQARFGIRPSDDLFRLLPATTSAGPEAFVFARLTHEMSVHALEASGATVVRQSGDLALVRAPIASFQGIAALPDVVSLSLSRTWSADLDSSRTRSRVKTIHAGTGGLPAVYKGSGVVVGVLDSGLDFRHPDFRTSTTVSRVRGLLDFSQGTDGTECRPGQLDSMTCLEIDGSGGHGHGTHVTGIASGNGRANSAYVGMAPEADIVFVKGIRDAQSNGGFSDADVVNGTAWILDKAASLGKPVAVNLSLGGQVGAHDGTSLQEQFLDRFVGPGRVIVAAAGNSGGDAIHAGYTVQGTDYNSSLETGLLLAVPQAIVDLWAPAGSNISVGLVAYQVGTSGIDFATPVFVSSAAAPGALLQGTAVNIGGSTPLADIVIDARTTADANNGARNVLIQISPSAQPGAIDPSALIWSVYTFGTGTFDMWANLGAIFFPDDVVAPNYFKAGNTAKTIGIPGTAKRIICVGSHVTKTQWVDIDNVTRTQPGATLDSISWFSSRGPSRDGRVLPNLTAPGEAILSALSQNYPAARQNILQGGSYQEQQGTSQASPHITGIVALMLQRDPSLTPENVRTILQQSATPVGASPNNTYGSGRVNALAALQLTPDPLGCVVIMPNGAQVACDEMAGAPLSIMAYPNPAPHGVRLSFLSPTRQRAHLALYDVAGRRVQTLVDGEVEPGVHELAWNGDMERGGTARSGVYFARLITPSGTRTIRLVINR